MKKENDVLIQNAKQANKAVAKVMRLTFFIFTLVYFLNVFGIFTVNMGFMTFAYIVGSLFLWIPTLLVNVLKKQQWWVKYIATLCAVAFMSIATITLGRHVVGLYIYGIAIASLYFSKKLNIMATALSVAGASLGQWIGFKMDPLADKNYSDIQGLLIYGIIPRALVLIAVAAIFTMLCERTAGMLSSLLGKEEQERIMKHMKHMQEKSTQTSEHLLSMVEKLSVITESSMEANGQIAGETGTMQQGFLENTNEIEGVNECIQAISIQLTELSRMNDQVAKLACQVNEKTKENQGRMDFATSSMEQIHESTNECKAVIERLGEASKEILGIVKVITGISSQTNILALNATIEAARAGEQGKGFAVVAEQIQKLSEQTKAAVENIGRIVNEVVHNTEKAVKVMEQSAQLTQVGMESIQEAGNSTATITLSNSEMSGQIIEMEKTAANVRKESSEVARSMEQVNRNTQKNYGAIEHVTAATQENCAGIEEIERMVERIRHLAEELNQAVQG